MTSEPTPSSPSRVKVALAVAWVLVALAAGGWSVDQSSRGTPEPAVAATAAQAGLANAAAEVAAAEIAAVEESPALTLALIGIVGAALASVIGLRIWWSTVASAHPAQKLAPSPARLSTPSPRAQRRGLAR